MKTKQTKTDNDFLGAKLALRKYFLRKYHANEPPRVIDCCQGSGVIWNSLREQGFGTKSYWGLDVKPKKGRMQLESERVLEQQGWDADVIDVDTYGSPWKHWFALLRTKPEHGVTVFLTAAHITIQGGVTSDAMKSAMDIKFPTLEIPTAIWARLQPIALIKCMLKAEDIGVKLVEVMEAPPGRTARYIGARIE